MLDAGLIRVSVPENKMFAFQRHWHTSTWIIIKHANY
jgi:hypothetical protein